MKKKYIILISVLAFFLIVRIILPYVVLHYANKTLTEMNGYYGHIDDIDLSLYRGAYIIHNIYLNKVDAVSKKQTEFSKSRDVDLSIEWGAIFHGSLVGKMVFDSPVLIFTKNKTELSQVRKDTSDFRILLGHFMPLKVNRFEIFNGAIHYVDKTSTPKVDISLKRTHMLALNLSNVINSNVELPSTVTAQASVYGGSLNYNMKLNALANKATFELNAELKNTNLVLINDFLRAYGNFDVEKGKLSLYTEMAAKGGKFIGYVKPMITDLQVLGPKDTNDTFSHKLWEYIVGGVGVIFKNQKENQIATKIRIEGDFNNPQTYTLDAVLEVLRNAFVQALLPGIDHEININSLGKKKPVDKRSFLQKIFSPAPKNEVKKK
ncbi:MAG: DUF748 domain-containing protein [Ignavibacteriaceae bacterium]